MSEKSRTIPPHEHCKVCGVSITVGKEYCSITCRQKSLASERRMKKTQLIYILSFVALMVIALILVILRPP